jgi:hypothetical protein
MSLIKKSDRDHLSAGSGRKVLAFKERPEPGAAGHSVTGLKPRDKPLIEKAAEDSGQKPRREISVIPGGASSTDSIIIERATAPGKQL